MELNDADIYWKRKAFSYSRYDNNNKGFYKLTLREKIKNFFKKYFKK